MARHAAVDLGLTVGECVEALIENKRSVVKAVHEKYLAECDKGDEARTTVAVSREHHNIVRHVAVDLSTTQGRVIELLIQKATGARRATNARCKEAK